MDISSLRERNDLGAYSVSELNLYIKQMFDSDRTMRAVSVKGEISNFTYHRSGHLYFTLKDAEGQIKAVMFRSSAARLKFIPENGMKVLIRGSVSVYQRDGTYQLYVNSMEPDGIGALYLAYEQLKERLFNEGLFDQINKKDIPHYPETVGVITSATGAAIRDIINVTGRRYPLAKIILYPSLVQGDGAEKNLIEALDYFEKSHLADVIIIGRGGGSIEDLWAFNSEALARKIYAAKTPIISAVGHETDFTICDFVADLRAPTPSAAAEIAVPDIREVALRIDSIADGLISNLNHFVIHKRERLSHVCESRALKFPFELFEKKKEDLTGVKKELSDTLRSTLKDKRNELMLFGEKIGALNPMSVLMRGFSLAEKDSRVIKSADEIKVGDKINITFSKGGAEVTVDKLTKSRGSK